MAEQKVIGYYGSWATYRNGNGKCKVEDIDATLCTHLIYSFVGINEDATIKINDAWLDLPDGGGLDSFAKFNRLKIQNPQLKTLIAVGGWNEGSAKFSKVANDPTLRNKFAKNAAEFTIKYGFNGMDMDWEYPAQRDSPNVSTDKQAFSLLLAEMRKEFNKHGLLLSAAVAAAKRSASQSYDIPSISQYLDFINIMTYDLHGPWDKFTGHNAALHKYDGEKSEEPMNVENAVNYWLSQGAPPQKLVLGIPLYGRTFQLTDSEQKHVGASVNGAGIAGPFSGENGMMGYNELCEEGITHRWPTFWDKQAMVPYTFHNNTWVSYDNKESIKYKVKFAVTKNLGGVMVWSIETDDFRGMIHGEKFPLLRTINKVIGKQVN